MMTTPASEPNPLVSIEFPIPFDRVRAAHVEPAIAELLGSARERLQALAAEPGPRTFENTMRALDALTEPLDYGMGVVRHLESVATYPELRAAFNAVQPEVSAFYTGIPWIPVCGGRFRRSPPRPRPPRWPANGGGSCIRPWRLSGATARTWTPTGKRRLEAIDVELTTLTTKFSENVLDSTNAFELMIADERQLAGLPPSARDAARESAARKGREGWRFTLHAPDYFALMTYLDDAAIRREVYRPIPSAPPREPGTTVS